jgi:hypothetical protein
MKRLLKQLRNIEAARHYLNRELSANQPNETRVNELTRLLIELNANLVDNLREVLKND